MYLARAGKSTVRNDTKFDEFLQLVKRKKAPPYLVSQISSSPISKIVAEAEAEEAKIAATPTSSWLKKIGFGYQLIGDHIPCSRSVLDDISRLEVLIGGVRAGNNSPEIINEATEICQRLFCGRVMDIQSYRKLVDKLVDYHSD